ncbi:hypothetical protein QUF31_16550 [Dickeya chrysanthemi]|uniref:hypothetical protein n=1 Tax=Dickeya chrysanthemi TaxID=556 RepID=UPI0025A158D7|nr:hypothetical protein [Dickeya chrysanthemi]WJM84720.1 hypothetical protein QUF31_16550 [Dickeya chrysanthemi]
MKTFKIVMISVGLIFLQGCDSQETKIKKLLKCGLAVNQVGSSLAKENYQKNGVSIFGDTPPKISSYDMMRIGQDARDELWMNGRNSKEEMKKLIKEYEEGYCIDMHKVPNDENIGKLKLLLKI